MLCLGFPLLLPLNTVNDGMLSYRMAELNLLDFDETERYI